MAGISKAERKKRREFLKDLVAQGYSPTAAFQRYDQEFGTHYSERL
jgi:hypothetical protein